MANIAEGEPSMDAMAHGLEDVLSRGCVNGWCGGGRMSWVLTIRTCNNPDLDSQYLTTCSRKITNDTLCLKSLLKPHHLVCQFCLLLFSKNRFSQICAEKLEYRLWIAAASISGHLSPLERISFLQSDILPKLIRLIHINHFVVSDLFFLNESQTSSLVDNVGIKRRNSFAVGFGNFYMVPRIQE